MINYCVPAEVQTFVYTYQLKIQSITFNSKVPFQVVIFNQVCLYVGKYKNVCTFTIFK